MTVTSCETTDGGSPPVSITADATASDSTDADPRCNASEIANDLDLPEYQHNARAEITECEPPWAVIRWDTPGDSQRMVRHIRGEWRTYVAFPHQKCWGDATADDVPMAFEKYFPNC
ncbi:hypothetical protein JDV09_12105 [Mycobacterium sp. Y57]|uniref:hypothetical protein n=1 Tax=Mycolicibacterium xanthum TaxID=2796469 RepID=UPI001C855F7D|nr:hypothetical protein [Mycolicibacterium xanthum]MBX7432843.1 hypothetical protein [Mycolicibacterium xanthum]